MGCLLCHLWMSIYACHISYCLIHPILIDNLLPAIGDQFLFRAQCWPSWSWCSNREERKITWQLPFNELLYFLDRAKHKSYGPHLISVGGTSYGFLEIWYLPVATGFYIFFSLCLKGLCTEMTIDINDINVSFICYYSWVLAMCQMDPC